MTVMKLCVGMAVSERRHWNIVAHDSAQALHIRLWWHCAWAWQSVREGTEILKHATQHTPSHAHTPVRVQKRQPASWYQWQLITVAHHNTPAALFTWKHVQKSKTGFQPVNARTRLRWYICPENLLRVFPAVRKFSCYFLKCMWNAY